MTALRKALREGRLFQLSLLAIAAWSVAYTRFTLGPLQEALRIDLALTDNQIAWLQGPALAVPMALGSIPFGLLIDRYSRVRLFVLFAALNLVATVMTALAGSFPMLMAARCMAGVAVAAMLVAAYSVVADLYASEQRGRATMVVSLGEQCGPPVAFAIGGLLLALGGSMAGSDLASWRWALLWMSVPLLLVLILMLTLREPPRSGVVVKNPPFRQVWPELWSYRAVVVPLLFGRIMVWIADGAVLVWAAPSFARHFALTPDRIGTIMASVVLISGLLGPVLGGPLADLCQRIGGPRRTMTALCILALLSIPTALFAIVPGLALASVLLTCFLTIGFTIDVTALSLATIVIPGELRALYIAVLVTVGAAFCIGVAPLVVSGLSVVLGGPAMIGKALAAVCCAMSVVGAIVFGFGTRYFPNAAAQRIVPAT